MGIDLLHSTVKPASPHPSPLKTRRPSKPRPSRKQKTHSECGELVTPDGCCIFRKNYSKRTSPHDRQGIFICPDQQSSLDVSLHSAHEKMGAVDEMPYPGLLSSPPCLCRLVSVSIMRTGLVAGVAGSFTTRETRPRLSASNIYSPELANIPIAYHCQALCG